MDQTVSVETSRARRSVGQWPLILVSGATATAWSFPIGRLYTPGNGNVIQSDRPWAIDNGAFSGFHPQAFRRLLDRAGGLLGCLFVAVPDVVADWAATRRLFDQWAPSVRAAGYPVAIVGQDGATVPAIPWGEVDAVFLGGSTEWKLSSAAADIAAYARARGRWVHMGRVNTQRRYRYAAAIGAHSVDGTFFSKWPDTSNRVAQHWPTPQRAFVF